MKLRYLAMLAVAIAVFTSGTYAQGNHPDAPGKQKAPNESAKPYALGQKKQPGESAKPYSPGHNRDKGAKSKKGRSNNLGNDKRPKDTNSKS